MEVNPLFEKYVKSHDEIVSDQFVKKRKSHVAVTYITLFFEMICHVCPHQIKLITTHESDGESSENVVHCGDNVTDCLKKVNGEE